MNSYINRVKENDVKGRRILFKLAYGVRPKIKFVVGPEIPLSGTVPAILVKIPSFIANPYLI